MKKYWVFLLLTLIPLLSFAADTITSNSSSMSFTPPPGDYSVIFLGNIFGVVDGVLHGTGSQIMGTMLGVFNSGVLALGGIVIMYIILVSTLNTAHEGEMLGHKWSSIWVPIRTIIGLSMLIPKASGYCAMQIFVMWVVVQGIGLADKVWSAALGYLNRGGVIIQANMNPTISMTAGNNDIAQGASVMLYGQVCMLGLQTQLENARQSYLDQANSNVGPCAGKPDDKMQRFCDTPVPDFISSVDPLNIQLQADAQGQSTSPYIVKMPQIEPGSVYASLNGICGTIQWDPVNTDSLMTKDENGKPTTTAAISTLTTGDIQTVQMTRGIAVGQMYSTLSSVARLMVANDPQININTGTSTAASLVATQQFGVPLTSGYGVCTSGENGGCPNWGADPTAATTAGVLLQGTEFQGAIADYNAIMAPTLKLKSDAQNADVANKAREFIQKSEQSGWILAGSYFFNLVQLNGSAVGAKQTDIGSGLKNSSFTITQITAPFSNGACIGDHADLCYFLNKSPTRAEQVVYLIDGSGSGQAALDAPSFSSGKTPVQTATKASTAYGYVYNGMNVAVPVQPGVSGLNINLSFDLDYSVNYSMKKMNFGNKCILSLGKLGGCVLREKGLWGTLYNGMIVPMINGIISGFVTAINALVVALIYMPMQGFTYIFIQGVQALAAPGVNPIVALAQMGITYIDFSMTAWIYMGLAAIAASIIAPVGTAALSVIAIFMPLFLAWLGVMLGIAFITAYYIPFLPYMLFTFGSIGWLITVIEAMVASPIVALGIAHPEGHDALGKGEQGLMILMNVFLRPVMMIIGYIAGISLSYVGVWIMNAGFQNVLEYLQGSQGWGSSPMPFARIFGFFFASLLYTSMYMTIVQKTFTLIAVLPDKVLRWIGSQGEQTGQEASQWTEESKSQLKEAGDPTKSGAMQTAKQGMGNVADVVGSVRGKSPFGDKGSSQLHGGGGSPKP